MVWWDHGANCGETSYDDHRVLGQKSFYEKCCPHRVACGCFPHRGTVPSWLWPSMSMSRRFWRATPAPALTPLSPEPSGLSQLLPGDELSVWDRDDSFQGSGRTRAGVGRGRGANSRVLGRSSVPVWLSGSGTGMGMGMGGGGLRRWAEGYTIHGSGRRGMSRVSRDPGGEHMNDMKDSLSKIRIHKQDI